MSVTDASEFTMSVDRRGDAATVEVGGELDAYTAPKLRTCLEELMDSGRCHDIVIDLSDVAFVDSTGLGVIVGVHRRMRSAGARLCLASPRPSVGAVLEITGLTKAVSVLGS